MGSYRNAYPSGGASASAAYHHSGDLSHSQRLHEPGGGPTVTGSLYGYDSGDTSYTSVSLALLNSGRGPVSELHSRTSLLANGRNLGISAGEHPSWRRHSIDSYRQTLLNDSQALRSDMQALYGQSLYPGVGASSLRTSTHTYSNIPDAFVQTCTVTPPGSLQAPDSAAESIRNTPSLEALIKETWELHSLFRAGLAADSKESKRSGNDTEDIMPRLKRGKQMPCTSDTLGKWEDLPMVKEETLSTWKELGGSCKQPRDTSSNNKQKDLSLLLDSKQEQYALNLQRFTHERVREFMGDSSDDHNSDDESLVDSDNDVPNMSAENSHSIKSREEQAYEFFFQMIEENEDLLRLYNEQCHVGKFECLVCSSIPGKHRKKYNGLISVIMHASKIMKTKKKQEHRGYARAVCSALGWDMCRLPTMPLGSSSLPRCCIPTDEEKNTHAEETSGASKENENNESGALDSEENSAAEENKSED